MGAFYNPATGEAVAFKGTWSDPRYRTISPTDLASRYGSYEDFRREWKPWGGYGIALSPVNLKRAVAERDIQNQVTSAVGGWKGGAQTTPSTAPVAGPTKPDVGTPDSAPSRYASPVLQRSQSVLPAGQSVLGADESQDPLRRAQRPSGGFGV